MVASLKERLNNLVNYSSQLIFVGSESAVSQTKALEGILFHQGENTELAYIAAEQNMDLTDFRQQLCQQLLGQSSQFYHRPLNECLASLNNIDGPVMITITRAEIMPRKLLQELWELVLQSRFAGNKQHLNVVLFANKAWAMEAKSWLPANHTGSPLLLTSEQVSKYNGQQTHTLFDGNTSAVAPPLDSLAKYEHPIEQRPIYSMGAFWFALSLLILCLIIVAFVWQRGEHLSGLFRPLEQQTPQTVSIVDTTATTTVSAWKPKKEPISVKSPDAPVSQPVTIDPVIEKPATISTSLNEAPKATSSNKIDDTNQTIELEMFVIQIAGFKDLSLLNRFLTEHNLKDITTTYQTQRYGGDWYVVISKQSYDSAEKARQAIARLPTFPNRNNAFIKSSKIVDKEKNINK